PEKLYSVAMPDFVATGGDGVSELMSSIPKDRIQIFYAKPIRDAIIDVLKKWNRPLTPVVEGRITMHNLPAG
ncbi:MAG TPA: hypothetical protein VFO89_17745, partial [Thermoanaerobaculia bacterium]|nr:hypothetical protein [Thermoanaerobaculia bacterium]